MLCLDFSVVGDSRSLSPRVPFMEIQVSLLTVVPV